MSIKLTINPDTIKTNTTQKVASIPMAISMGKLAIYTFVLIVKSALRIIKIVMKNYRLLNRELKM